VITEKDVIDLFREEEYLLLRTHANFPASTECANSQTKEITMSNPVRPIPQGYHSITPAITCKNASKAIDFYKNALGASEIMRMAGPGGTVGHAELRIGDSVIFVSDEFPGMAVAPSGSGPASSYLFLYTDNVDTVFNRAVSAGCRVDMPLDNMFWGDRYGKVTDPFGHHWGLAQHVEDVAPEEMKRRSAEWSAKMAKAAGQS
jgi:PhnB protein